MTGQAKLFQAAWFKVVGASWSSNYNGYHVCIFVYVQMCVTVPQLTGEWKLFPADVSLLPAVCTSSSPTVSSTGKRSVIITINNIVSLSPPLFYFHLAVPAYFRQLSMHEDLLLYISFKNPFKSTPLMFRQKKDGSVDIYLCACAGGQSPCHINKSWLLCMCVNICQMAFC